MYIDQYLDVAKLAQYIDEGIVDRRIHPTLPLSILCYSRRATYENLWDDITEKCRGLIVDNQGLIVARPFEKFFNLMTADRPETHFESLPQERPQVFEKLDGSLGIHWSYKGLNGVASKGSFTSDHAIWATYWYRKNCKNEQWPAGFTPVFEMICENVQRHVISYDDIEDQLILLALINNETGEEADYNTIYHYAFLNGLKTVDIFSKTVGETATEDRPNKEGYILSWPRQGKTPLKVKVKHPTFLKLQKIVHAANPKTILEALSNDETKLIEEWEAGSNPELAAFIRQWREQFVGSYGQILVNAKILADKAGQLHTRKDQAEYLLRPTHIDYSAIAFLMLDHRAGKIDNDKYRVKLRQLGWKQVAKTFEEELTQRPTLGDPYDDGD